MSDVFPTPRVLLPRTLGRAKIWTAPSARTNNALRRGVKRSTFTRHALIHPQPAFSLTQPKITKRNQDGRIKRGGSVTNFYIFYELDEDTSKHVLLLEILEAA